MMIGVLHNSSDECDCLIGVFLLPETQSKRHRALGLRTKQMTDNFLNFHTMFNGWSNDGIAAQSAGALDL